MIPPLISVIILNCKHTTPCAQAVSDRQLGGNRHNGGGLMSCMRFDRHADKQDTLIKLLARHKHRPDPSCSPVLTACAQGVACLSARIVHDNDTLLYSIDYVYNKVQIPKIFIVIPA